MQSYLNLVREVARRGERRADRTGVGTRALFARALRFDLSAGFPAVTTKRLAWRACATELCWWLRGESSIEFLTSRGVKIWDAWATDGDVGPVYGVQWRRWPAQGSEVDEFLGDQPMEIDQLAILEDTLAQDPASRRHLVSAWNVAQLDQMALPPCHLLFQCYVSNDRRLSLQVYQRSSDLFLGVPFDLAAYAALTHLLAARAGLGVGELTWVSGDTHLYENHLDQVDELLSRAPRPAPTLVLDARVVNARLDELDPDWLTLEGYDPHPAIRAPVAV